MTPVRVAFDKIPNLWYFGLNIFDKFIKYTLPLPGANTGFLYGGWGGGRGVASEILPTSHIPSRVGQKKLSHKIGAGWGTGPRPPPRSAPESRRFGLFGYFHP